MTRYLSQFAFVTILPAVLLVAVAWGGWVWALAGLIYLTLFSHVVDILVSDMSECPVDQRLKSVLPLLICGVHFTLLATGVALVGSGHLAIWETILVVVAYGQYFATVSNAVAHELIHRPSRLERFAGKWMFISHLFGHHTSAHLLVHHPLVATKADPNSARYNETFTRFWRRAWRDSFLKGLAAENARRASKHKTRARRVHPYIIYSAGALGFVVLAIWIGGLPGLIGFVFMAFLAQTGLLLTDYVQHYGLQRRTDPNGKSEPVAAKHSWNSPHWFTRHLTLNATRHSDHHTRPTAPYTELNNLTEDGAPILPYPAGVMGFIALFPRLWRPLMNPRVVDLENAN